MLAQPEFKFLSAAEKVQRIESFKTLHRELDRTRDLKQNLEYRDSFDHFFQIVD